MTVKFINTKNTHIQNTVAAIDCVYEHSQYFLISGSIRQSQIGFFFGVTVSEIVTVSESDIIVSESDTIISHIVS